MSLHVSPFSAAGNKPLLITTFIQSAMTAKKRGATGGKILGIFGLT
jgi:hypothetical protein